MRVLRGRVDDVDADRATTAALAEEVGTTGEPAVRVWYPGTQVAFGRRDARSDGYEEAKRRARDRGFQPVERAVGGRAVAYTGATLVFARIEPTAEAQARGGIEERYETVTATVREALAGLGVEAREGEPENAFCPGTHSLQRRGKLVGIAQRVRQDAAVVAGVLVVRDREAIASVLGPVYDALGVPFDPDSVGSLSRAGGETDLERVRRSVERALVGNADVRVERAAAWREGNETPGQE